MNMNKKKVSFDIEPNYLDDIKKYCAINKMNLSDFYREAVTEKLKKEENYLTIFAFFGDGVQKVLIEKDNLNVTMFDAEFEYIAILGAKKQGVVSLKATTDKTRVPKNLLEALEKYEKVNFFTK